MTIAALNNVDERDMQGSDTEQDPVEAPGQKTLPVSLIFHLQEIGLIPPPWHSLRGRFKQLLIRKGRKCETGMEQSRETTVQPWGKALVLHQGIQCL